jgi:hypothetical protein
MFWIQSPLALTFGVGIFFSIPSHFTSGQKDDGSFILDKLARVDYLGAITLVRLLASRSCTMLISVDHHNMPLLIRPIITKNSLGTNRRLCLSPDLLHLH